MKTKEDIITMTATQSIGIWTNYFNSWKCAVQEFLTIATK